MGASAFAGAAKLWEVVFDDALLVLNDSAFEACVFLINVDLGNSLHTMGSYCFRSCTRLLEMELPGTLETMGSYCYNDTLAYNNAKDVVYIDDWAVGLKSQMYVQNIYITDRDRGYSHR